MLNITAKSIVTKKFVRSFTNIPRYKEIPNLYNKKTSSYKPKLKQPKGLIHHPPPSAPSSTSEIPDLFLPNDDPRKGLNLSGEQIDINNAPPLSTPSEKKYHLSPKDVEEIQRLRASEPYTYTKKVLAEKFNVSPFTISLVSDVSKERKQDMDDRLAQIKQGWSKGKAQARLDRKKRQQYWYRDE